MTPAEQMIAARRRLAALGLATHWLRSPEGGGKAPIAKNWQHAPYCPPELVDAGYKAGCNLGVHCGLVTGAPLSVIVVDLDSAAALEWARAHLPPTPWRTRTRHGEHWYYKHPGRDVEYRNKAKIGGIAIDIRGDGGQVVCAPSVHKEGHVYAEVEHWEAGAVLPTFDPAWLPVAAPAVKAQPPAPRKAPLRERDPDLLRRRASSYLSTMPAAISGQRGHDRCLAAAAALVRGFCLPDVDALQLLRSEYNPRCDPPWTDRELEHKVREAAKLTRLPADGWLRDAERPHVAPPSTTESDDAPPWWPAVPDEVREADAPPARPQILVTAQIHHMRDEAVAALGSHATTLYSRQGMLVDVIGERLRPVPAGHLRALMTTSAEWMRHDRREGWVAAVPPREVVAAVMEAGQWPPLRELRGIVEAPTLRPDGSILSAPGYDAQTGLYLSPGAPPLEVPDRPGIAEARRALETLMEVVADFPFAHEAGRSAWLAGLLTMVARHAIDGPVPLLLIDANTRGTGKTLLADAAHHVVYGRELEKTPQGKDGEEDGKLLLSLCLAGVPVVLWDNIAKPFGNAVIDAALTSGHIRGRVLGKSEAPRLALVATWWATGNNVRLRGDLVRRCLRIRLVTREETPEGRRGFRHAHLLRWVKDERPRLLGAALTLLRAYCAAGRPAQPMASMGSFEAWSDLVRGAILWLDQPDPLAVNDEDHADSDEEAAALPDLIDGWDELCRGLDAGWCSVPEAVRRLQARDGGRWTFPLPALRDALSELCGPEVPTVKQLGALLTRFRDRVAGGRCIVRKRDAKSKGWHVVAAGSDPSA